MLGVCGGGLKGVVGGPFIQALIPFKIRGGINAAPKRSVCKQNAFPSIVFHAEGWQ